MRWCTLQSNYFVSDAMLDLAEKQEILKKAKVWFSNVIAKNHIKNTVKLKNPALLDINPFLVTYLATFLNGNSDEISIARALIYPRVLGSSITTSFGHGMQSFVTEVLGETFGSTTTGIDIEFIDQVDGEKKYCQVKLGPNTINKDDVETINGHFAHAKNLGRTNNLRIGLNDLVIAVLYGEEKQVKSHYKRLRDHYHYPLLVGNDFWYHLTGDKDFYKELLEAITSAAKEAKGSEILEQTIQALATHPTIKKISRE